MHGHQARMLTVCSPQQVAAAASAARSGGPAPRMWRLLPHSLRPPSPRHMPGAGSELKRLSQLLVCAWGQLPVC